MCEWGTTTPVIVKIPASLSHTGKDRWAWKEIDSCIADIVEALERAGIDMQGSCCGHGKGFGDIILRDGRFLTICERADFQSLGWALRLAWQIIRNRYLLGFKRS